MVLRDFLRVFFLGVDFRFAIYSICQSPLLVVRGSATESDIIPPSTCLAVAIRIQDHRKPLTKDSGRIILALDVFKNVVSLKHFEGPHHLIVRFERF